MPILKQILPTHVLQHAQVNLAGALGTCPAGTGAPHWRIATPVSRLTDAIEASAFYRSITEQVDDEEKRANFAVMMNALNRAAYVRNYPELFKGFTVTIKVAHTFKYAKSNHKLWELKQGKKDRMYFYPTTLTIANAQVPVIVPFLAHHKKDQTTPKEVIGYCEPIIKTYLAVGSVIQLI